MDAERGDATITGASDAERSYAEMVARFHETREIRGVYLDQAINIEAVLDETLCALFRINSDDRLVFKETMLGVATQFKIDALRETLKSTGLAQRAPYKSLAKRLQVMNERRVMFAHSRVALGGADRETWHFSRYRNGTTKEQPATTDEMRRWLKEQEAIYRDLLGLPTALMRSRAGTAYVNAISKDGTTEWWDVVPVDDLTLPDVMFNDFIKREPNS